MRNIDYKFILLIALLIVFMFTFYALSKSTGLPEVTRVYQIGVIVDETSIVYRDFEDSVFYKKFVQDHFEFSYEVSEYKTNNDFLYNCVEMAKKQYDLIIVIGTGIFDIPELITDKYKSAVFALIGNSESFEVVEVKMEIILEKLKSNRFKPGVVKL